MKIRSAGASVTTAALTLVLALGAAGCGKKDDNANNSNTAYNANANARANANATTASTPVTASEDTAIKNKTEAALTKAGLAGVTVEVDGGTVTLKGSLAKAKWQDAMKAANESGAKKVNNQLNEK
jgi:osmotically-inducible protein OsmY